MSPSAQNIYAVKMNQIIKRERKKARKKEMNSVYMSDKQRYLKFWFAPAIAQPAFNNQNNNIATQIALFWTLQINSQLRHKEL